MKRFVFLLIMSLTPLVYAAETDTSTNILQQRILQLQQETQALQAKIEQLNRSVASQEKVAALSETIAKPQARVESKQVSNTQEKVAALSETIAKPQALSESKQPSDAQEKVAALSETITKPQALIESKQTSDAQEKVAVLSETIAKSQTRIESKQASDVQQTPPQKIQLASKSTASDTATMPAATKVKKKYHGVHAKKKRIKKTHIPDPKKTVHNAPLSVHSLDEHPETLEFYPAALIAENHVVTYIAGMPVVSSPFLGARPAFDGSDYIVNISSINRDIRLMEQRRRLYRAFDKLDYPTPNLPVITVSGKVEPLAAIGNEFTAPTTANIDLGSNELDVAAALNDKVEAYMALSYDSAPPSFSGQRVANSSFNLNMGFVNIGDLDETPLYFTAGQIYVPFGRYSTSMISPPLTMQLSRTKNRPFVLGYKSQTPTGPFAAIYGFSGDTTQGSSAVGGVNVGQIFTVRQFAGEIGASFISSMNNAAGMQKTGSIPNTTFGGFGSLLNGNENVRKTPGIGAHTTISFDRYNLTAEWVTATEEFRQQDLSFNNKGAKPSAGQLEGGVTFMSFHRPSSVGLAYQWSREALALNLPNQRINAVYNISVWKDTVESLEYRHDIDYGGNQYANGASAIGRTNLNTIGTGKGADTVLIMIGVYF